MKILSNKIINRFLTSLFVKIYNFSYSVLSILAVRGNDCFHPKHQILKYHEFFRDNVESGKSVIDIGCGNGFNAFEISKKAGMVVGIDINQKSIAKARSGYQRKNLTFVCVDLLKYQYEKKFDYIILSNVLEHIDKRIEFLKMLHRVGHIILIRVPMIDRDWLPVYLKNINQDYRLDPTHFTEFTVDALKAELKMSKWRLDSFSINFGEIWGVVKPQ